VALGMVAATRLAVTRGMIEAEVLVRLMALLERIGLPTRAGDLPANDALLEAMALDKKVAGGRIRLVLPERLGAVAIVDDASDDAIAQAWDTLRT
jgi:3-dehydroquinate synthase